MQFRIGIDGNCGCAIKILMANILQILYVVSFSFLIESEAMYRNDCFQAIQ